jgi:hypothetical protein
MCCTHLGYVIDLSVLPVVAVIMVALIALAYGASVLAVRRGYVRRHGSLL